MEQLEINIEHLREDLKNYFGTAIKYSHSAIMDLNEVETANPYRLIEIALKNNFDLNKYIVKNSIKILK